MPKRQLTQCLRALTVPVLIALSLLVGAGSARAGGPTSALLVSPGNQQAAAVYYSDPEYEQLSTLLGGGEPVPDNSVPAPSHSANGISGSYVTVTWLIHDVSIWRIDRIILTGDGAPWIVTEMLDGGQLSGTGMGPGESGAENAIWHRSSDPAELTGLLTGLGLLGSKVVAGAIAPVGDQQNVVSPALTSAVDSAARASAPWWWALAGIAAGGLLTAALVRFVPGVRDKVLQRQADDTQRMVEQPG